MSPIERSRTKIVTNTEYRFSGRELLSALENGSDLDIRGSDKVSIYFQVPIGGDYSGVDLAITPENPVVVNITREEVRDDPK